MGSIHRMPLNDTALDREELTGRRFLVTETWELLVVLDGTEEIDDGDTILEVVEHAADDYPEPFWERVDRSITPA